MTPSISSELTYTTCSLQLPITECVTVAESVQYVGAAAVLPALTALTLGQEGPAAGWSTLIGRGSTRLGSHWSRAS